MKNKRFEMLIHPDLLEAMDYWVGTGFVASNRSEFIRLAVVEKLERLVMDEIKKQVKGG